jgi:DNA repair protein RadC
MAVLMANVAPHERPRERLWALGAHALLERELLAIVLREGTRGESALDLAAALLDEFGGLAGLAEARPEELARRPGVGEAKAAVVVAAFRMGRLSLGAQVRELQPLRGAEDVVELVRAARRRLDGLCRERVLVLVCDARNRVRREELVSIGAIDRSAVPVREILNCVLRHDGRAFALAHNHPSGDPTPSEADVRTTRELAAAAQVVGVRFLDHIVIGRERWASVPL